MAISTIVIADFSTLTVGGTLVEAAQSVQASRNADTRPIYTFNKSTPQLIVTSKGPGNGSFSYLATDGTGSALTYDWSSLINGSGTIVISGGNFPAASGSPSTLSFSGCTFGGQSMGMNVRGEAQVTVNFVYTSGTW